VIVCSINFFLKVNEGLSTGTKFEKSRNATNFAQSQVEVE